MEELRIKFGFSHYISVDRIGRSGGLVVMWKKKVECSVTGYSTHHIDVVFTEDNADDWRLSCFYGFLERSQKKSLWNMIRSLERVSQFHWCIFGDFNDQLFASDKKGRIPHPQYLSDVFRAAIEKSGLAEVDLCGGNFIMGEK